MQASRYSKVRNLLEMFRIYYDTFTRRLFSYKHSNCDLVKALEIVLRKIVSREAATAILFDFRDFISSNKIYFIYSMSIPRWNRGATYLARLLRVRSKLRPRFSGQPGPPGMFSRERLTRRKIDETGAKKNRWRKALKVALIENSVGPCWDTETKIVSFPAASGPPIYFLARSVHSGATNLLHNSTLKVFYQSRSFS